MAYCTQANIEHILSEAGVELSADDDSLSSEADITAVVDVCIERAETKIKQYFSKRYDTASLSSSNNFVKWATATLAAKTLCERRGNQAPISIEEEWNWFLDQLEAIASGSQIVDGLSPTAQSGMAMANFRYDQRFRRVKSRVEIATSVPRTSRRPRRGDYNFLIEE